MTNLKRFRQEAGITQSELADLTGISVRVLQNYEQGVRELKNASAELVLRVAKALNTTVEELISED